MDELVKMLLDGKSDKDILERIHQLEASNNICFDKDYPRAENSTETKDVEFSYKSSNQMDDRHYQHPRLSESTRSQCQQWKAEAMQKETLIVLTDQRDVNSLADVNAEQSDSEISTASSMRSDSDMEPRSFSEIRKRMQLKRHQPQLQSQVSTPRSGLSTQECTPRTGLPTHESRPRTGLPTQEFTPRPGLSTQEFIPRTGLPTQILTQSTGLLTLPSANTSYTELDLSLISQDYLSLPEMNISEPGASTPVQMLHLEDLSPDYKASAYSDCEEEPPALRYDSTLSVNTVVERILTPDQSLSQSIDSTADVSNNNSPREHPLRRQGSYTLEKPSPLLQAHMLKFGGSDDDVHDMSHSQRLPHQDISSSTEDLIKIENENQTDIITKALYAEVRQFSLNQRKSVSAHSPDIVRDLQKETISTQDNIVTSNSQALSQVTNSLFIPTSTDDEISESLHGGGNHVVYDANLNVDHTDIDSDITVTILDSLSVLNVNPSVTVEQGHTAVEDKVTAENLEKRVQNLADGYVRDLKALLHKQEEERISLRLEFEQKQKELVDQIIGQFPGLQSFDKENISPDIVLQAQAQTKEGDPNNSLISTRSHQNKQPLEEGNEEKSMIRIPEAALSQKYERAWIKLSALARGFLVRRLVATEKVQNLKRTIKDTVACAVKLHLDTGGDPPSPEDLELHSRLLVQLESACASLHRIFFQLGVPERMAILALDREAKKRKIFRPSGTFNEKKITAVTRNRIEKKNIPSVTIGRQVLSKLQENSPYQQHRHSTSQYKPKQQNNYSDVDNRKESNKTFKNKNNNKAEKLLPPEKVIKKVIHTSATKLSPSKPAWK